MREIKFRAWDKKQSEMSYNISVLSPEMTLRRYTGNEIYIHPNSPDYVLMQFTGFKDSRGDELFESDLIQIDYSIGEIFWDNLRGEFAVRSFGTENKWSYALWHYASSCEKIGNIFEKSETLEQS